MRLYVQWTTDPPGDWVAVDVLTANDWRKLPSKPEPTGGETIDGQPGWVAALMCQGVAILSMDHHHVVPDGASLVITSWNDDPQDWSGNRHATQWRFDLPTLDGRIGKVNTRQSLTVWRENPSLSFGTSTTNGPVEYLPWADFVAPGPANMIRHGIWVTDPVLWELHLARLRLPQNRHGWREWIGG